MSAAIAAAAPLLRARGLAAGHGRRRLVEGLDLEVRRGDRLVLVGPNGSGKTTLLRTLLGLQRPLAGTLERSADLRPAYCPQRDAVDSLWPWSALEVVRMAAVPEAWMPFSFRRERDRRARAALARVGLDAAADTPFRALSGGQRQGVLLARALAPGPTLIALDEPSAGLDAASAARIGELLRGLAADEGIAVVLVTHDPAAASADGAKLLRLGEAPG